MKKLWIIIISMSVVIFATSSAAYRVAAQQSYIGAMPPRNLTVFTLAELVTGAPAGILHGIAMVESGNSDSAIGDDGISIGRFQINERYHSMRARAWGEYDPHNPSEAAIIAGHIFMDNLKQLGSIDLALCAYRQGIGGVLKNGPGMWYAERVRAKS